jgi:hypothetical protein
MCFFWLVVAGLSATGVLIWWRKLQSLAARSLTALLCLVAGILLAGALTGAFQNVL